MGWASGTDIVTEVAKAIKENVKDSLMRRKLYLALVCAAEDQDWDCHCEAEGIDPILDKILNRNNEDEG